VFIKCDIVGNDRRRQSRRLELGKTRILGQTTPVAQEENRVSDQCMRVKQGDGSGDLNFIAGLKQKPTAVLSAFL
jgi:hypothetical protein